ncbi:hypothetical protein B0H13DRAFT_1896027 [Mycena leptocephala]|nr:hypothetical protein B0H13DRAFT_1896027 [Mycena leptocephala]
MRNYLTKSFCLLSSTLMNPPTTSDRDTRRVVAIPVSTPGPGYALDPDVDRRRRHADAQRRYREKFGAYKILRAERELSADETRLAAERRRPVDADYRERKFIAKFGHHAFIQYYLPLHNIFGEHLPGRQFVWSDEKKGQRRKRRQSKTKPNVADAAGVSGDPHS